MFYLQIGEKIKRLRLKNNLTIDELAQRCELTKGFISQLERDLSSPSIETLSNILEVLGTNLSDFFKQEKSRRFVFTTDDRYEVSQDGYKIEWLVPNAQANEMEPILLYLEPHKSSQVVNPFEGEIFGYVLEGEVVVHSGKRHQIAYQNDSFYLHGNNEHYLRNEKKEIAKILWISTPPIF